MTTRDAAVLREIVRLCDVGAVLVERGHDSRHPDVPWSLIKRMPGRLAHHYEGTDYGAFWDTLVVDLPAIRGYLARLDEGA